MYRKDKIRLIKEAYEKSVEEVNKPKEEPKKVTKVSGNSNELSLGSSGRGSSRKRSRQAFGQMLQRFFKWIYFD